MPVQQAKEKTVSRGIRAPESFWSKAERLYRREGKTAGDLTVNDTIVRVFTEAADVRLTRKAA